MIGLRTQESREFNRFLKSSNCSLRKKIAFSFWTVVKAMSNHLTGKNVKTFRGGLSPTTLLKHLNPDLTALMSAEGGMTLSDLLSGV